MQAFWLRSRVNRRWALHRSFDGRFVLCDTGIAPTQWRPVLSRTLPPSVKACPKCEAELRRLHADGICAAAADHRLSTCLYVVEIYGHRICKIGITTDIAARFATFESSIPFQVELRHLSDPCTPWAARQIELWMHGQLAEDRIPWGGREWFRPPSIDKVIAALVESVAINRDVEPDLQHEI